MQADQSDGEKMYDADFGPPLPKDDSAPMRYEERPKVITLCGSTRFWNAFQEMNAALTLQGCVVFSVAVPSFSSHADLTEQAKATLDRVHRHKIRMSDEIMVLNVGGYIGESTRREIEFAHKIGRKVAYLEPLDPGPLFEK